MRITVKNGEIVADGTVAECAELIGLMTVTPSSPPATPAPILPVPTNSPPSPLSIERSDRVPNARTEIQEWSRSRAKQPPRTPATKPTRATKKLVNGQGGDYKCPAPSCDFRSTRTQGLSRHMNQQNHLGPQDKQERDQALLWDAEGVPRAEINRRLGKNLHWFYDTFKGLPTPKKARPPAPKTEQPADRPPSQGAPVDGGTTKKLSPILLMDMMTDYANGGKLRNFLSRRKSEVSEILASRFLSNMVRNLGSTRYPNEPGHSEGAVRLWRSMGPTDQMDLAEKVLTGAK